MPKNEFLKAGSFVNYRLLRCLNKSWALTLIVTWQRSVVYSNCPQNNYRGELWTASHEFYSSVGGRKRKWWPAH